MSTGTIADFNRNRLALLYAQSHQDMDPGVMRIYLLEDEAPPREIRLLEINNLLADRELDELEPIEFGIDRGTENFHTLVVLDVTPSQWEKIKNKELRLPDGWSLKGVTEPLVQVS